MLCAYGDESSDETKERVFAVGAVLGAEEQWALLERKWVDRTGGIAFHANECDSDQGDFKNKPHNENKQLYADLVRILADSGMGGYTVAIDLASRRQAFPDVEDMDWSYYKAFQETIEHTKNCALFNGETVKFIFDTREESTYNTGILFRIMQLIPNWRPFISSGLTFEYAKNNPRLQAADLFVREVMKAWDNRVAPVKRPMRKSWKRLLDTGRFHGEVLGMDWFNGLRNAMTELEKKVGLSMEAYGEWLREKNLGADNVSNRLLYIELLGKHDLGIKKESLSDEHGISEV